MYLYSPHLIVVPEDDANREIALGFMIGVEHSKARCVRIEPVARGWVKVVEVCEALVPTMMKFAGRHIVLLMDFDGAFDRRSALVIAKVPLTCRDRVFLLGTRDEPQDLKVELRDSSFESIGKKLAKACESNLMNSEWNAKQLNQNAEELARLQVIVRPMLF